MDDARGGSAEHEASADLHHAAGVPGGDEVGLGVCDALELRRQYGVRRVGLDEIVNAGAAAALIGIFERYEIEM